MITNEQVTKAEDALRIAQEKVEEAARVFCNARGDTPAGEMYRLCSSLSYKIADVIHEAYKARN